MSLGGQLEFHPLRRVARFELLPMLLRERRHRGLVLRVRGRHRGLVSLEQRRLAVFKRLRVLLSPRREGDVALPVLVRRDAAHRFVHGLEVRLLELGHPLFHLRGVARFELGELARKVLAVGAELGLERSELLVLARELAVVGARPRVELPLGLAHEEEVELVLFDLVRFVPVAERDGELLVVVDVALAPGGLQRLLEVEGLLRRVLREARVVLRRQRAEGRVVRGAPRGQVARVVRRERVLEGPAFRAVRVVPLPERVRHQAPMLVVLLEASHLPRRSQGGGLRKSNFSSESLFSSGARARGRRGRTWFSRIAETAAACVSRSA